MSTLTEQIARIYHEEQANPKVPVAASDLPVAYEDITPQWLSKILFPNNPEAQVESLQLGPVDSGSSNRRKIKVQYNTVGQAIGLPTKLFCKASHGLDNRVMLAIAGALHAEIYFYQRLIQGVPSLLAPNCLFARYDDQSYNSLIILEDLTDAVESFCDHNTPMNLARAKSQMQQLAIFHAHYLQAENRTELLDGLGTWVDFFERTYEFGMEAGSNLGFVTAEAVIPPATFARYDEIWPKTVAAIQENKQLPSTLIHNDVHLKNWYVLPNDQMGLSDWQCAGSGHWGRDIAYALSTALTVEDRRAWEKELIAYYVEQMRQHGVSDIDFDSAWLHYSKQMIAVLPWWTNTLTPGELLPDMQPKDITLEFIRRITVAMEDLGTLDLF